MASHSYLVDPYLEDFTKTVAEYHLSPPTIPYISCLTGNWIGPEEATNPGYWARQLRSPVQFESMVRTALSTEHGVARGWTRQYALHACQRTTSGIAPECQYHRCVTPMIRVPTSKAC
ncbi:hypothetical protein [Bradyrhizobium sp. BR 1432]|uniref:hypothetical protein n=1 Tax=Bradyrhizobium sp. BR 1432 TaxID=3447966 RepID=UPI003EE751B7